MQIKSLETATAGDPITRMGISFMPIYLEGNDLPAISTGPDSGLTVEELDDARVGTLLADNPTDTPILILEGEHFLGGKQNRSLNVDVLVPPKAKLGIPVSCLERGRWGRRRRYVRSPEHAHRRVRRRKSEGVHASMERAGSRRGSQGGVWAAVDDELRMHRVASPTAAAQDVSRAYARDRSWLGAVDELVRLGPLPQQCGLAVAHGEWIVAIDLFGAPQLLATHWGALVKSYMLERPVTQGMPLASVAVRMIQRFGASDSHDSQGIGLGMEKRVKNRRMTAQGLVLDGSLVHASIFTPSRHMPSYRRRPEPPEGVVE